ESFHYDPKQAVISCPHLCRSMSWMLEAAGIEVGGIKGAMKVAGLTALYIKTLRVWRSDESVDMAKVMAALDKDLGRVEGLALRFGL
ncbi:MAG: TetR family transcriptional regulator, partial [Pseudomonadota bacterium]|nr:TetR family transcriptional regulator [Pseudomonadota bacterium]